MIVPADERRHPPGAGRGWEESWYLDFVDAGGGRSAARGAAPALAGYLRLTLRPAERTAWFWVGMVGGGPELVTVRDHEVTPPVAGGLEVRAPGLWTELVCETPLDHWSVGLEAFGVALDDPLEAWGRERGDPWALGLDVEWEAAGPAQPWEGDDAGYWQGCAVHGDVLVGAERFALDGAGTRVHTWGERPRSRATGWAAGRLDDGTDFLVADPGVTCDAEGRLLTVAAGDVTDGAVAAGDVTGGAVAAGDVTGGAVAARDVTGVAVAHAPVLVPGAGRLARALCRYETAGGGHGHGWAEWFHPADPG